MKVVAIGDVHGRQDWKKALKEEFDLFVFVGDYFDSRENILAVQQIRNFKEIMELRSKDPRFITLLGNHDFQYLRGIKAEYSGFQYHFYYDIQQAIEEVREHLDIVKVVDKTIFSHAGLTNTFFNSLENVKKPEDLNRVFKENPRAFHFNGYDPYGDDITQGPLWVRPNSLLQDNFVGFDQIVGHTHFDEIEVMVDEYGVEIAFIDTLPKYLVKEI